MGNPQVDIFNNCFLFSQNAPISLAYPIHFLFQVIVSLNSIFRFVSLTGLLNLRVFLWPIALNLRKSRHPRDLGCTWTFDRCIPNWGIEIWYQVCADGIRLRQPYFCNLLFRHRPSSRGCTHWENIQTRSCGMFLWSERFYNLFLLPGKHSLETDHTTFALVYIVDWLHIWTPQLCKKSRHVHHCLHHQC